MTTVTAVMPAYNGAKYIRDTLESVLGQQDVTPEVIVVDDGSTDGTWDILEGFGSRIRTIRSHNQGPARARNLAASNARGEWLAFIDADDLWLPDKLSKQLAVVDDGTGLVFTDVETFGECEGVSRFVSDVHQLPEGDVFRNLLFANYITCSSVLIRRSAFVELGGFCEEDALRGVEDWDLWLRVAAKWNVKGVHEPLTQYRWHNASLSRNVEARYWGHRLVLARALAMECGREIGWLDRRRIYARAARCAAWNALESDRRRAQRWFLESAAHYPIDFGTWKQLLKSVIGVR